jgi:hypothetical protein
VSFQASTHDVAVNYVSLIGPAAINLSDTAGRYMWILAAIKNNSSHNEMARFGATFSGDLPVGCQRTETLVLPGQVTAVMAPGEQKTLIWRVRYQCHAPATPMPIRQAVTVGITHCDPSTSEPGPITEPTPGGTCPPNIVSEGTETNLANNTATAGKQILVQ